MKWVIEISSSAEKEIEVLQDKMAQRTVDAIFHLAENPFPNPVVIPAKVGMQKFK